MPLALFYPPYYFDEGQHLIVRVVNTIMAHTMMPDIGGKRASHRTIQINGKQHYLWRAVDQDGDLMKLTCLYLQKYYPEKIDQYFFANHRSEMSGCIFSI